MFFIIGVFVVLLFVSLFTIFANWALNKKIAKPDFKLFLFSPVVFLSGLVVSSLTTALLTNLYIKFYYFSHAISPIWLHYYDYPKFAYAEIIALNPIITGFCSIFSILCVIKYAKNWNLKSGFCFGTIFKTTLLNFKYWFVFAFLNLILYFLAFSKVCYILAFVAIFILFILYMDKILTFINSKFFEENFDKKTWLICSSKILGSFLVLFLISQIFATTTNKAYINSAKRLPKEVIRANELRSVLTNEQPQILLDTNKVYLYTIDLSVLKLAQEIYDKHPEIWYIYSPVAQKLYLEENYKKVIELYENYLKLKADKNAIRLDILAYCYKKTNENPKILIELANKKLAQGASYELYNFYKNDTNWLFENKNCFNVAELKQIKEDLLKRGDDTKAKELQKLINKNEFLEKTGLSAESFNGYSFKYLLNYATRLTGILK